MADVTTLLGQYVFPIVMCLIMAYYVKDQSDKHREEIEKLNSQHREEVANLTSQYREQNDNMVEAVSNNTQAIIQLTEVIRNDKD
jgi:uncharacterized protein YacL